MSTPSITVVITTYNYGRFIEECVHSVLAQEYPAERIDIVVVDDGSTDDTAECAKKYNGKIRYFHQPNGGQASSLNLGLAKARGEIIALLDADDYFLPSKLARVSEAFASDAKLGMVYHPYWEWNAETGERRESTFTLVSGDMRADAAPFAEYYPHPTSCVVFRRTALERVLPIPEKIRMLADAYATNLIPFVAPIRALPQCLTVYRTHGKNCYFAEESGLSPEARRKRSAQWKIVIDAMRKWLVDNGWPKRELAVRDFLVRWERYQRHEEFLIEPPGRWRFFWSVVRENHADGLRQTWKFTVFNYVMAFSALVFGYDHAESMNRWRLRVLRGLQRFVGG